MIAHVQSRSEGTEVEFKVRRGAAEKTLRARLRTPPKKKDMTASAWVGKPLPQFELVDVETGETLTWEANSSEVLVLDFWATWCGPCRKSMPVLEQLHGTHAEKGLRMNGFACSHEHGKAWKGVNSRMEMLRCFLVAFTTPRYR